MTDFNYFSDITFIADEPAKTDAFPSGTHTRVAATLVDLIQSNDGGRAIALEGTWGSGKSTIIDLARTTFEERNQTATPKHAVFIFDTWAHQGDPMRRAFLDALIDHLTGTIISSSKWTEKLERLRSLRKKVTEQRAETLSLVARVSLFFLPILPLAYLAFSEWLKPKPTPISVPYFGTISITFIGVVAILIIAAPYLAALITLVRRIGHDEMKGRSIIVAFNRQTDQITTEQLIKEDEATTLEFNNLFDEIVSDARGAGFRLVIVLDNLDRLANDQIREIWATMRNFFAATPGEKRTETLKNVWLVVPIDRKHIEAVFADGDSDDPDHNIRGFVEKTFEISLRVPPPLLSNWRDFFSRQFSAVYKDKVSPAVIYRVFRLFELYQTLNPRQITPRAIKSYINKVVAQTKLSGDTVPMEYQALYVLYKDRIAANIGKLQDSTILEGAIRATVTDPDWTKYLAAAHFNVLPDVALEVLMATDIESALLGHEYNRLDQLSGTSGFSSILHDVVLRQGRLQAVENPSVFFDMVDTVSRLQITDAATSEHIWDDICECVFDVNKPVVSTDLTTAGIKALLDHARPNRKIAIARAVRSALSIERPDVKTHSESFGAAWFNMIEALIDAAKDIDETELRQLRHRIPVPQNVEFLLGAAGRAAASKVLTLENFEISSAREEVTAALVIRIEQAEPPSDLESVILAFVHAPHRIVWATILTSVKKRLQQNSPTLKASVARQLLLILEALKEPHKPTADALKELSTDGSLHGLIQLGQGQNDRDLCAIAIDKLIDFRSADWEGPAEHPQYGQLAPTNAFLKKLQNPRPTAHWLID